MKADYYIVGLGNPGEEYARTRHNIGREAVQYFAEKNNFDVWKENKKLKAHIAKGTVGDSEVLAVCPDTYMNKSGTSVLPLITSVKKRERLIVVYDDIDLPIGKIKLSFGRGSGGHNGVESIIRALKTKDFVRVRVGIAPTTASGAIKKPHGEEKVLKFLLGKMTSTDVSTLEKGYSCIHDALTTIVTEGREVAMNRFN